MSVLLVDETRRNLPGVHWDRLAGLLEAIEVRDDRPMLQAAAIAAGVPASEFHFRSTGWLERGDDGGRKEPVA